MKPKVLVTGATGKPGSQVARQLLVRGWPVRAGLAVAAEKQISRCKTWERAWAYL